MSLFADLLGKIFGHTSTTPAAAASPAAIAPAANMPGSAATPAPVAPVSPATPPAAAPKVDVSAVLDGLAAGKSESLDWKHSIVDLMKLVGMDSSLSARKQLAAELHYTGDTSDSATMNVWLHKAVLQKLSDNGGKVPAELLD